jgi:putative transposase
MDMSDILPRRGALGTYTRGYLPHFDHEGLVHLVTFRLADSLPQAKRIPLDLDEVDDNLDLDEVDAELDRGHGSCLLRDHDAAGIVVGALRHFDGDRYDLGPWVIMPNHVHLLLRPLPGHGLGSILHSWKSFTAKQLNARLGRSGALWQREYFDRCIRNRRHFQAAVRYTHENPVAAGLVLRVEDWPFSSARDPSYVAAIEDPR